MSKFDYKKIDNCKHIFNNFNDFCNANCLTCKYYIKDMELNFNRCEFLYSCDVMKIKGSKKQHIKLYDKYNKYCSTINCVNCELQGYCMQKYLLECLTNKRGR